MQRSVFDRLPDEGRWGSALLLDGNVGIGGDPRGCSVGSASSCDPAAGCSSRWRGPAWRPSGSACVRSSGGATEWFPWARVGVDGLGELAGAAGLRLARPGPTAGGGSPGWTRDERYRRPGAARPPRVGPFREGAFRSPLHSVRVASILGIALGVTFTVCFVTGFLSHLIQHPPSFFAWPPGRDGCTASRRAST